MKYSTEFKSAVVQKYLDRGNRTVKDIVGEIGIASSTIYQWFNEFASISDMKKSTQPQCRHVNEKLKCLIEYDALAVEKRGEYLRKNGLHEDHLKEWRQQIEEALSPNKKNSQDRIELIAEQKKVKHLEKELNRKDRALAEASALLILKKKADLIWGVEEDE